MIKMPSWTVVYNIVSPENKTWIGRGYEFFDEEKEASLCYARHISIGNCPTKRPFFPTDWKHLGVVHEEARKEGREQEEFLINSGALT